MSLVSLVRACGKHDVKQAIARSLDLIEYEFTDKIGNIAIKPNMCYYWDYSTGQTTDPAFVAALIEVLRDRISKDVKISVVESDASVMKCKYAFKFLGYEKLAGYYGIDLINLSKEESQQIEVWVGEQPFHFMVPEIIRDADLKVNVPKIKYHTITKISCALKNIYGCNPYPRKYIYHRRIDEVIVALNKAMNFDLCILDGIIVAGSQTRKLGLVMTSRDPVAVDTAAARLAKVNPRSVRHIMLADEEGVGNMSFGTVGIPLDYFEENFPRKRPTSEIMQFGYELVKVSGLSGRLGLNS